MSTFVVILLCWPLASILTAIAFCRALGAADMREQALDQRSDADGHLQFCFHRSSRERF